jgi:WD40 repeat protein
VDGKELLTMSEKDKHTEYINTLRFSPDGTMLASASGDMTIRLWDVATGALIRTLSGHTNTVREAAFAPDGQSIFSTSGDDTIRQWRISDGVEVNKVEGVPVSGITFTPDGQIGAIGGSWENKIYLVRLSDGAELTTLEGHTAGVSDIEFSPDGTLLASVSDDMTIGLWGVAPP